jgi:hypothetical protein
MTRQRDRAPAALAFGGFGVLGVLGFICLLYGLAPGFQMEQNAEVPDVSTRCPTGSIDSEAPYDVRCARDLMARGPLALGVPALATAFLFGLGAIGCLGLRRGGVRVVAWIMLALYLVIWLLMVRWNATEGRRLQHVGAAGPVPSAMA